MNSKIISFLAIFSLVFLPMTGALNAQEELGTAPVVEDEPEEAILEVEEAVAEPLTVTISSPADGATVMLGESFSFVASADGGEAPYAYVWSFGDGTIGAGVSVGKEYEEVGSFDVSLEVTDFSGNKTTDEISVIVEGEEEVEDLSVTITTPADNAEFEVDESISFAASVDGGEAPYAYVWSFGDGITGAGVSVDKSYAATGTYTVTVAVTDFAGTELSDTINVVIAEDDNGGGEEDLTISNIEVTNITHDSATITWTTNRAASSRVIYDTESHPSLAGESAPNFGYTNSTGTTDTAPKVSEHSVTVTGLAAETSYYFRVISQE